VPKKYFKPPKDVIKEWPEVFEEIYMSSMPIKYINGVELTFNDGRVWEIDLPEQLNLADEDAIIEKLSEGIRDFQEEISTINFQVDIDRLKQDIIKLTQNILGDK
jgi:hypothetical protein